MFLTLRTFINILIITNLYLKGQSTNLFETIISERRKNYIGKTRLWNKSTSSKETDSRTPSPLQKRGRNRPSSTHVNVDSEYDSHQTNLCRNLYSFINADIEKMSVLEKVINTFFHLR